MHCKGRCNQRIGECAVRAIRPVLVCTLHFLQYATDAFTARRISPMLCSGDQHTVPKKNHDGGDRQISLAGWVPQSTGCSSRSPTHHYPHLCSPSCAPTRLRLLYVLYGAWSSSGVSCSLGHQSAGPPPLGGGRGGLFGASFPGPPSGGGSGGLFGACSPCRCPRCLLASPDGKEL